MEISNWLAGWLAGWLAASNGNRGSNCTSGDHYFFSPLHDIVARCHM